MKWLWIRWQPINIQVGTGMDSTSTQWSSERTTTTHTMNFERFSIDLPREIFYCHRFRSHNIHLFSTTERKAEKSANEIAQTELRWLFNGRWQFCNTFQPLSIVSMLWMCENCVCRTFELFCMFPMIRSSHFLYRIHFKKLEKSGNH